MKFDELLIMADILSGGKNRKQIQNIRALSNIVRVSNNPEIMKKVIFHNMVTNMAPNEFMRRSYDRVLRPQERKLLQATELRK